MVKSAQLPPIGRSIAGESALGRTTRGAAPRASVLRARVLLAGRRRALLRGLDLYTAFKFCRARSSLKARRQLRPRQRGIRQAHALPREYVAGSAVPCLTSGWLQTRSQ
eukprot:6853819-Alexandrium_andersonii.AAC.1